MKLTGKATAKKTLTGKISGCEKIYISADTSDATATEDDIAIDKTAYIRSGKAAGKLPIETAIAVDGNASLDEQGKIQIAGNFDNKRAILEKSASVSMSAPASDFGDASAEDVAKGKKFTSVNGLNVTGTRETFTPSGTRVITMNGKHYIADYEYAQVEVAAGGDVGGGDDIEIGSLSELHQWSKYTIGGTVNETVQDSVYVDLAQKGNVDGRVYYADKYSIVDGALTLNNPTLVDLYNSPEADRKAILGKYINPVKSGGYYLVPRDAAITRSAPATGYHYVSIAPVYKVEYTGAGGEFVGIVVSEDSNAYPQSGEQDGYKYVYNGTLGSGVELPTLSNPGVAEDLLAGKELIDANGNVVTGTVVDKRSILDAVNINPVVLTVGSHTYIMHQYTPSKTMMVRDVIKLCASIDKFGTATAADVAKGKTFTSAAGLTVTGTLYEYTADTTSCLGHQNAEVYIQEVAGVPYLNVKGQITGQGVVRKGAWAQARAPLATFGDAAPEDVRAGKTFTSADGFTVEGTNTFRDIKTITIKEV